MAKNIKEHFSQKLCMCKIWKYMNLTKKNRAKIIRFMKHYTLLFGVIKKFPNQLLLL